MPKDRPYVFIGSSAEGLPIAEAIQANLDHDCECHIWYQGLFGLSGGTLETLVGMLDNFDFAVLACTPDDVVISGRPGSKPMQMPRDNVLLELGMFIGAIGRHRTFMVINRDAETKMPSDLAGITPASFAPPQAGNFRSALGAACSDIKAQVAKLGKRKLKQHRLAVHATLYGADNWSGIAIEITNADSITLPPHRTAGLLPKP